MTSSEDAFLILSNWKKQSSPLHIFAGTSDKILSSPSDSPRRIKKTSGVSVATSIVLSADGESDMPIDLTAVEWFDAAFTPSFPAWRRWWVRFLGIKLRSSGWLVLAEARKPD
jgi:hypothetical protein